MGLSLGTGPACFIMSAYNPGAAILVSPFSSLCDIIKDKNIPFASKLVNEKWFNNLQRIIQSQKNYSENKAVKQELYNFPILVIHGENDNLVPLSHGQALYEAIR